MPNKENNEYFDLELSQNNKDCGEIDPSRQLNNKSAFSLESDLKDSEKPLELEQASLPLEQNLNSQESLTSNDNSIETSRILQQSLTTKDNNFDFGFIKSPLTDFSANNHTLKQTTPLLKQDNQKKNYEVCENKDLIDSKHSYTYYEYNEINSKDSKIKHENNEIDGNLANTPSVYTKEPTKAKKQKKIKQKRNPIIRLTLFFVTLCFIAIVAYKILANGIFIERLEFGNITIHNIFLKLKNKLVLKIDRLELDSLSNAENDNPSENKASYDNLQNIVQYTQKMLYVLSYFEQLHIKELRLPNNKIWNIDYTDTNYRIQGTLFEADFAIANNYNNIQLTINKFQLKTFPLHFEGILTYVIPNKNLLFDIRTIKNENIKEYLSLKGSTDFKNIALNANSSILQDINIIKPLINNIQNLHLRQTLQDWIFNNIEYENLRLTNLSMNINFGNLGDTLLHKTKANIVIENPKAYIAKNTKPIIAKQVALTFENANLSIKPIGTTFAGMDLNGSEILIANMPHSDFILDLHGKNVRFDSNLAKLLQHYHVSIPIIQPSLSKNATNLNQTLKTTKQQLRMQEEISNIENLVTKALQTRQTLQTQTNSTQNKSNEHAQSTQTENIIISKTNTKTLEIDSKEKPNNKITINQAETESNNNESIGMYLQIAVKHNNKVPTKPIFSLQGIIQAKYTNLKLYNIPLKANKLNIALTIDSNQKNVYINGEKVKWNRLIDADVNVLLDLNNQNIKANTYIHKAILNTGNLKDLKLVPNAPTTMKTQNITMYCDTQKCIDNNYMASNNRYIENYINAENELPQENQGIYLDESMPYTNMRSALRQFKNYSMYYTNAQTSDNNQKFLKEAKKRQLQNRELSPEVIKSLPKHNIKDDGKMAKEDDNVLKDLKSNPVWNDLKIHSKKTQPFKKLSTKELTELALKEIELEKDTFVLPQDFLSIKNANIHLNLSFANDKITLDIPALSLYLESGKNLQLNIANIENILQFSPLARYYGIEHGDFKLYTTPYQHKKTESFKRIDFALNLTQLQHPLYTIKNKRVSNLNLKGQIQNNSLIVFVNDDIDFKSQDSLSMLRMKNYRIDIDEALRSKIPFFVELFKDKKKDTLPYSEASIAQELKFISIKNKLRRQLKVKPIDFNIIGENLQLTFLGYTAPLDSVNMRFIDGRIIIDGQYGNGILNASLIKDNVYFRAKNFSGDFINIVLASAKGGKKILDNGTFSFDGIYRGGVLNTTIELQNTALIEFKSVQNIFALIDTLPSLFMFKDPHISTQGYQVNYGKVLLAVNSDYIGLQNIFLLGSSMDINGQGIIDIDTQEMNVNLSISTVKNLSKFINKIPIIGYLILGREGQISTNLILSGKYIDPKVNITLAADIIKAPFNILRRVFPVEMLVNNTNNDEDMMNY